MKYPVLFTCRNSNYLKLGCDCFDEDRNALTFGKTISAIYHPPCGAWCRLRAFHKVKPVDRWLGLWALIRVRRYGGILEQPANSLLFTKYIIKPGSGVDKWGGFSIEVDLHWFGFPARKKTWLYFVGCSIDDLVPYPYSLDAYTHVVGSTNKASNLKELSRVERSKSPMEFCKWSLDCLKIIYDKEFNYL